MNLNILWFILVATLFCVYFFLDGMDFGVGMLLPFLGRNDKEKQKMLRAIGPTWGSNEVWVLTAGGAMFASFPGWYATMFSGFYPALFLLLVALIARGLCIEFRHKAATEKSRKACDTGILLSSLFPPLLLAVALACLLRGVPIDANFEFTGTLLSLFSPFTLLAGLWAVSFFVFHGAMYLAAKLPKETWKLKEITEKVGLVSIALLCFTILAAIFETDLFSKPLSAIFAILTLLLLLESYLYYRKGSGKLQLVCNALVIASTLIALFGAMFPRVMVSSTSNDYSLTVYNASSSHYTLQVISIVTLTLLPVVAAYIIWAYWFFAKDTGEEIDY